MTFTTRSLVRSLASMLSPLSGSAANDLLQRRMLDELGIVNHDAPSLASLLDSIADLERQIDALARIEVVSLQTVTDALALGAQALSILRSADAATGPFRGARNAGRDLATWLISVWLQAHHPVAYRLAALLTLIEPAASRPVTLAQVDAGVLTRGEHRLDGFALNRIAALLRNPVSTLRDAYLNDLLTDEDAWVSAERMFPPLVRLLRALGVPARYGVSSLDVAALGEVASFMDHAVVVYGTDPLAGQGDESGLVLSLSPAARGDLGLVVSPFGALAGAWQRGDWDTELRLDAALDVVAFGRHGATLLAAEGAAETPLHLEASAQYAGPAWTLGDPDGTRLEIEAPRFVALLNLGGEHKDLSLGVEASSAALVMARGGADGFLSSLVPPEGIRVPLELGLTWASGRGFSLRGGTGLDVALPVNLSFGGARVSAVDLRLAANESGVGVAVCASVAAAIGPVGVTVKGLGLRAHLRTTPSEGNLGIADLSLGLSMPDGVGLRLDAGSLLTGGGYVYHDAATGSYAGALQVSVRDGLTLNAYGLISTRLPSGQAGFSLMVFLTADGFKPVPLGLGFMLQSVGGMLAIHRGFNLEVLRAGLRAGTLATLLFPRDPVGDGPALMQALAAAFPVQTGSYLLGLLARITWFTPTLVQMDLALIMQLGAASRLLALGRVSAMLPTQDNDLIRLNLDVLGVLDFDAGEFAADALLVDSRIARRFPITGSAAMRAQWSEDGRGHPSFVIAVGGMNPRFTPPSGFPALERVAIALGSGRNPRLVCDAYLALTANTVQFGARVSLHAEALGFTVTGDFGFDALITMVPPHFIVDFRAAVQLKRNSRNLFKVTLDGTLEGPLPLRLAARARFEILWINFSVRFDFTLAQADAAAALPAAVDVADELARALADPSHWRTRTPTDMPHGVSLRSLPQAGPLVLDPLGQLELRQRVVPLNAARDIDTYGGLPVKGQRRFKLAGTLNGRAATPLTDAFAPARYFSMSDDEKIAAPSFERFDAGLLLGDTSMSFDAGAVMSAPLVYEQITLDDASAGQMLQLLPAGPVLDRHTLTASELQSQIALGAAARAPGRSTGKARFRNARAVPLAVSEDLRWVAVPVHHGGSVSLAAGQAHVGNVPVLASSWSECAQRLASLGPDRAQWVLQPCHERND